MRTILALTLIFAIAAADLRSQFTQWASENGKTYTSSEFERRLKIFSDNVAKVEKHNAEGHSWSLGLNKFADLTHEEFIATYLQPAFTVADGPTAPVTTAFADIDWTKQGAVTAIKDQGQCGSCWSFSATGAIEGAWQISGKTLTSFSEQQAVDCASRVKYGCGGCNGGSMDGAFKYYIDFGGIETEADYPYKAVQGTCVASTSKIAGKISKYSDVKSKDENALYTALTAQPVSVAIDASLESFQLYKNGVYCPDGCSSTTLDHGVLLVGYISKDTAYYLKNSWGTTWGEKGFFELCQNNNKCGIATMASVPIV